MILDFEDIARIEHHAERSIGVLEFHCDTLGLFDGAEAYLEGPMKAETMGRMVQQKQQNPDLIGKLFGAFQSDLMDGARSAHVSQSAKTHWHNCKVLLFEGRFRRSIADLTDQERAVLSASCGHVLAQHGNEALHSELLRFVFQLNAKLVWACGRGQFEASDQAARLPEEALSAQHVATSMMKQLVASSEAEHAQEMAGLLSQYVQAADHAGFAAEHPGSAQAIAGVIQPAQTLWATPKHIAAGETPFKPFEAGADLLLGTLQNGGGHMGVGFSGHESLVTVAQPGAGKTQCHVLPNLLSYVGPIVALDPKLELLEQTAGFRQAQGNRVLVLSLADDDQPTHRFNVLEFIDTRPEFLWGAVIELADFLIPENPSDNNPIFRTKASELLAVCLGGVVLEAGTGIDPPTLPRAIHWVFSAIDRLKDFLFETQDRAEVYGCLPLAQSAGGLAALIENDYTREDFQRYQSNATSVLMKYRGGLIDRVANGASDWAPEDLRQAGTTLYIRIPYEEMSVYGGFVRMVLYLLIKRLRKAPTEQDRLPVTFLLDEVAQLGNLDQIANVIETGRGFGLRAWMIFQDEEQARAASSKPNLLLKTPRVRLFMDPSLETAQHMSAQLGSIHQILTGKEQAVAEPAELMGPAFRDEVIVLTSGARPLRIAKHFAYEDSSMSERIGWPYRFRSGL